MPRNVPAEPPLPLQWPHMPCQGSPQPRTEWPLGHSRGHSLLPSPLPNTCRTPAGSQRGWPFPGHPRLPRGGTCIRNAHPQAPSGRAWEVTEGEVAAEDSAGLTFWEVPLSSPPPFFLGKGTLLVFLPSLQKTHMCLLQVTRVRHRGVAKGLSSAPQLDVPSVDREAIAGSPQHTCVFRGWS